MMADNEKPMSKKLKRLIRSELQSVLQDTNGAIKDPSDVLDRLQCVKNHIATIESEVAYERTGSRIHAD